MKKLLLLIFICKASSQIAPYLSTGVNISLNNNNGIIWGYEVTGGVLIAALHCKVSYGKKYFGKSIESISYFSYGGGITVFGYEKGSAKKTEGFNNSQNGSRTNIYVGGFIYPIAIVWDVTGMVQSGILPTNFYSREKFKFSDSTYVYHNLWQKFALPLSDCLGCD